MKYDLSIIGLGYVGLPLGLQFAKSGCRVLGLDIDLTKVKEIESGRSYIRHIPAEAVAVQVKAGKFTASSDFSLVKQSEAVLICVPTPLNKNREPADTCKIKSLTDWKALVSFPQGLSKTTEWIKRNLIHFDLDRYTK